MATKRDKDRSMMFRCFVDSMFVVVYHHSITVCISAYECTLQWANASERLAQGNSMRADSMTEPMHIHRGMERSQTLRDQRRQQWKNAQNLQYVRVFVGLPVESHRPRDWDPLVQWRVMLLQENVDTCEVSLQACKADQNGEATSEQSRRG